METRRSSWACLGREGRSSARGQRMPGGAPRRERLLIVRTAGLVRRRARAGEMTHRLWLGPRLAFDPQVGQPARASAAGTSCGRRAAPSPTAPGSSGRSWRRSGPPRQAEAHLLDIDQPAGGEAGEDGDHDQRRAGDDLGRRLQPDRDRLAVVVRSGRSARGSG